MRHFAKRHYPESVQLLTEVGGGMDKEHLRQILREAVPNCSSGQSFVFHGPVSFHVHAGATAISVGRRECAPLADKADCCTASIRPKPWID